jgi:hypothetical protein
MQNPLLDQRSFIGVRIHRRERVQIEHTFDHGTGV